MNFTQIKCFLSLGRTLNYSKTADEMFMSQPAVSKNIKKLESELGVQLVVFAHHKVSLTENGRFFWNKMIAMDAMFEDTLVNMRNNEASDQVSLNIGFTDIPFERSYLPRVLETVRDKFHYQLSFTFLDPNGDKNIISKLTNQQIDLMLFQSDLFSNNKALTCTPLLNGGFSVAISRQNPLSNRASISLRDLAGYDIYLWEGNENIPAVKSLKYRLNQDYAELNVKEIYDTSILEIYAGANRVLGIVPSFLYNPTSKYVNYVKLNLDYQIHYSAGYLREKEDDPHIKNVIKAIRQAILIEKKSW